MLEDRWTEFRDMLEDRWAGDVESAVDELLRELRRWTGDVEPKVDELLRELRPLKDLWLAAQADHEEAK